MPIMPKQATLRPPVATTQASKTEVFKPFGPTIGKAKMPGSLVKYLNTHCDNWIKEKAMQEKLSFGHELIGNVTQELHLSEEVLKEGSVTNFIKTSVSEWIKKSIGKEIERFEIQNSWIVRQFEHEYNPLHTHSAHISGVGYLKVPDDFGATYQNQKRNLNGQIEFMHGSKHFLCSATTTVQPAVGDFYFFPNYLFHTVYPFIGNSERRSISFNAFIDEDIYNAV